MATIYAKLINQYDFKYHFFSASFLRIMKKFKSSDEIELLFKLNINHKLTEADNNNFAIKSHLKHQNQVQETEDSGWIFDKN